MNELRIIHLETPWTILLDIAIWFVIHMGVVLFMVSLPVRLFSPDARPFRPWRCERDGELHARVFRVRAWKHHLPDGADILPWRAFPKRNLEQRSTPYLERFAREGCRAEVTHVLTMIWAPFFFLWNPLWVGWLMIGYALAENVPLIIAQRYNRARIMRIIRRRRAAASP